MPRTPEQRRAYYLAHREEVLAKRAAYRIANREAIRLKKAADYHAHREEALAKQAAWYVANTEDALAYAAAYRETHREKIRERMRVYNTEKQAERKAYRDGRRAAQRAHDQAYYAANRDKKLAKAKAWIKAHPEEMAAHSRRRRARKSNAPINDFTPAQWQAMLEHYHYRCQYCPPDCVQCKKQTHKLTQDHITPLSKGGSHTLANIVPCCQTCNSKKHAGPVPTPVQPLLL